MNLAVPPNEAWKLPKPNQDETLSLYGYPVLFLPDGWAVLFEQCPWCATKRLPKQNGKCVRCGGDVDRDADDISVDTKIASLVRQYLLDYKLYRWWRMLAHGFASPQELREEWFQHES